MIETASCGLTTAQSLIAPAAISVPGVTPAYGDRYEARTKLAQRRQAQNLSQEQLAHLAGVSLSALRRLEAGTKPTNPGIVTMIALATALRCNISDLLETAWYEAAFKQGAWSRDAELYDELRRRREERIGRPPSQI